MTTISREYINDAFWHNTVVVNIGNYSAVDFSMTIEQKQALFDIGLKTAEEVLPIKLGAK